MAGIPPYSNGLPIILSASRNVTSQPYPAQAPSILASRNQSCEDQLVGLSDIGVLELFESDDRAIIILDLTKPDGTSPAYKNPKAKALGICYTEGGCRNPVLDAKDTPKNFLQCLGGREHSEATTISCCGLRWTRQTLRKRWRIIAGTPEFIGRSSDGKSTSKSSQTWSGNLQLASNLKYNSRQTHVVSEVEPEAHQRGSGMLTPPGHEHYTALGQHDIFAPDSLPKLSPHVRYFLAVDWAATELGPISSWPVDVRRMCNFLMTDPRPAGICWGTRLILMYNEAYMSMTGWNTPQCIGQPILQTPLNTDNKLQSLIEEASKTGRATVVDESRSVNRNGYIEEIYYSMSIVPFSTTLAPNIAFYSPVFDTTRQVIASRRAQLISRLGQEAASARETKDFWSRLLSTLEPYHPDVPYALIYSKFAAHGGSPSYDSEKRGATVTWLLEAAIRIPCSEQHVAKNIRFGEEKEALFSTFNEALKSETPTLLSEDDGTFPHIITKAFGGTPTSDRAAFIPIRASNDEVLGFFIIGLDSQRRFDVDYRLFIELLSRELTGFITTAVIIEEEARRNIIACNQAAEDRNRLARALEVQSHEADELGNRFRRMADMAPVAMFHMDTEGRLIYANEVYYELTKQSREDATKSMSWREFIHELDLEFIDSLWNKLFLGETCTSELRLKQPWKADEQFEQDGIVGYTWIIFSAYPEMSEDGTIIGVLGCLTDISKQKWAEGFQKRKMLEAIELKRQQENFIDMTSHEMRNPLSAILQCADMIVTSITGFADGDYDVVIPREALDSYADAASTITLCAQHQKRIIDDILILSKLDSDLFFITPIEVQPLLLVDNALRMFDGELRNKDVTLNSHVNSSLQDLNIDWLKFDPSRMLQVIINLLTNAIKFTQSQKKRAISITVGASLEPPSNDSGIVYLERSTRRRENTPEGEWGDGEVVYLKVEVQDSGRGLDEHEQRLLFQRFSQASPRTHVQYGGSGLGLFISRELTELQGGRIGLASTPGVGSTFAFYIRARRCGPPEGHNIITPNTNHQSQKQGSSSAPESNRPRSNSQSPSSIAQSPPVVGSTELKHVLIVEDNVVNQKVLSKQLQKVGCIVSVANHGVEALSFLESSSFSANIPCGTPATLCDIVLMDLEMPVMDGLVCVKEIRKWEKSGKFKGRVPVIALTANARSEHIASAKDAGMDSVVTKPFRIRELVPELEMWIAEGKRTLDMPVKSNA